MLKLYDYLETITQQRNNHNWYFETKLNYFVSEIMQTLSIINYDEINTSIKRAFQICETLKIPVNQNFKKIYCFDGISLIDDWKISPLACYLIIINCNPIHESVAKAQVYFAMHQKATI